MKYRRDRKKGTDKQTDIIRHKREKREQCVSEREQCVSERERERKREGIVCICVC